MEKAFTPLQELIILRMEANLSNLVLTKSQFLELMTNAGFDLNPDSEGGLNVTKQIQFIKDKGFRVYPRDGQNGEFGDTTTYYIDKECRELAFCW